MGEANVRTGILSARRTDTLSVWIAVIVIPLFLIAPALWNGYPLLEWDTGGYLARWYEGYLVPSRSTVFGLYLHVGERSGFWLNLGIQALATLWILQLTLRVLVPTFRSSSAASGPPFTNFGKSRAPANLSIPGPLFHLTFLNGIGRSWRRNVKWAALGMSQPFRLMAIGLLLMLTTALPWLASMLLTDIFAGLSVLSLFILIAQADKLSSYEKFALFVFTAFAAATHSATLGVLLGLCCLGFLVRPLLRGTLSLSGLVQASLALAAGAVMLVSANYALSGKLAWTPGGTGVAFGRMLQDGIVTQYLRDHCGQEKLKLCPYRNELPATADQFLWGNSMFNTLGRFNGLNDEMGYIVTHSLAEYPAWQAEAAIAATARQLVDVATGEGVSDGWLGHTYGIMQRYIPDQIKPMRAAHQQLARINFAAVNRIHVPVALISMLLVAAMFGRGLLRRRFDDLALLAATVSFALLGNALICGVISGPHDRYGARMAWIATLTVLLAAARYLGDDEETAVVHERRDRKSATPAL